MEIELLTEARLAELRREGCRIALARSQERVTQLVPQPFPQRLTGADARTLAR